MDRKKKKYYKALVSFGVGIIILTCAVFANYENAGGYSICKEALKKVAYSEDFSADYTLNAKIDNEDFSGIYGSYKLNVDGNPSKATETTKLYKGEVADFMKFTRQDNNSVYEYYNDGEPWGHLMDDHYTVSSLADGISPESGDKVIFFAETICDTMIGDLKNNFVLTAEENGIRTYNVSLSKEQMPSYVTAGVSLLTSLVRQDYAGVLEDEEAEVDPIMLFFGSDEPYVQDITMNMSVDKEGNPVQITGIANVVGKDTDGKEHILSVDLSTDFYDFGSTKIKYYTEEDIKAFGSFTFVDGKKVMLEE